MKKSSATKTQWKLADTGEIIEAFMENEIDEQDVLAININTRDVYDLEDVSLSDLKEGGIIILIREEDSDC